MKTETVLSFPSHPGLNTPHVNNRKEEVFISGIWVSRFMLTLFSCVCVQAGAKHGRIVPYLIVVREQTGSKEPKPGVLGQRAKACL